MNIEEAREALEALLRSLTGTQAEVMEAADAFALTMLEEVVKAVTHDNDMGAFECSDCAWGVQELRSCIEELGK